VALSNVEIISNQDRQCAPAPADPFYSHFVTPAKRVTFPPPTPHAFLVVDGEVKEDPEVRSKFDRANLQLHQEINRRMAQTGDNEILIFVHGFKNSFDHAAVSLAALWHFIGRRGVPMLYSCRDDVWWERRAVMS
jgi:hypothetical protein